MSAIKTKIILDTNILVDMERIFSTLQPKITPKPSYKELWQQIINDRTIISSDKYLDKQYKNDYKGGINAIKLIHDLYNQQEKFEIHIPSFVYNEFTFRMSSKISVPVRSDLKDSPTSLLKSLEDLHIVKHIDRTELSEGVDYPNKYKVKNPKKPTKAEEAKLKEMMLEFLRNKQSSNNNVKKLLQHLSETTQTNIDTVTKNLKKLIIDVHDKYELWDKKMQKLFDITEESYKTKTALLNSLYTGITEYPNKISFTSGEEILTQCLVKNGEIFDFFDLQIYLYAKEHNAYILTQNTAAFQEVNDPHFLDYFHAVPILHPLINFESLVDFNHVDKNLQSIITSAISRDFGKDIILSPFILKKLELSKLDNTVQDIINKIQSEYFNSNPQQEKKELKSVLQDYPLLDTIKLLQFEGDTLKVNADKLFSLKNLNENNKIKILEFINKNFFQQELKQTNFIYTTHQPFTELIEHSKSKSTVIQELLKNKNKLSEYENKDSQILSDFLMTLKDDSKKDKQSLLFKALAAQNFIDIKEIIWDLKLKIDQELKDNVDILNTIKQHINNEITQKKSSLEGKNQLTLIREMQNHFEYIESPDGLENIKQNEQLKLEVQRWIKHFTDNFITEYQKKFENIDYKRSFVNERISTDSKSITKFLSMGMKKHIKTQKLIKNFVTEYLNTKNQNVQETDITAEFIEKSSILSQDPTELTDTLLKNERLLKKFIAHELSQEVTEYKWHNLMKIATNPQESSFLSSSVQEVKNEYFSKSNDVSITSIQEMSKIDIQNLIEQRKNDINNEISEKQQKLEKIPNVNTQLQHDNKKKDNILKQAKVSLERELNKLKIEKNKISDHNQYIEDLKKHERKIKEHREHAVSEDHIREHEVHEHMRGEHKGRIKRFVQDIGVEGSDNVIHVQNPRNILFEDTTKLHNFVSNSASSFSSPINTAINWLSSSCAQLKSLSPDNIMTNYGFIKDSIQNMQSIFGKSEHISSDNSKSNNVTSINIGQFDVNSSLTLANFIIRYFTKVKPYNTKEEPIGLLGVKAYVLNIITEFEESLNDPSIQSYLPVETLEFDPVVLMSQLEKAVINGDYIIIGKILHKSIVNNNYHLDDTQFSSYIQDKINEMLAQQNAEYSYNQQLISDYSSNNHNTAEDMNNMPGIENDVNYTNHQSEVNLIG